MASIVIPRSLVLKRSALKSRARTKEVCIAILDVLLVTHDPKSTPGTAEEWCRTRGLDYRIVLGQDLSDAPSSRALIVMGGDMESWEEEKHPWLKREKQIIGEALAANRKLIGICLGCQLLAEQAGGRIEPMKKWEIGWFPVELKEDHPGTLSPLHWHSACFTLPPRARILAVNANCDVQAFALSDRQKGFQFHTEINEDRLSQVLKRWSSSLHGDIESKESLQARAIGFMPALKTWFFHQLDRWWSAS